MVAKLPCWDLDSRKLPEPPVGASTNVQPSDMLSLDFVIDRLLDQEKELEYVSCRHLDKIVMEVCDPVILQSKSHRMSLGCSKQHSEEIHKNSQQTLAIKLLFLCWSQSRGGCSTTAHLGQL